MLKSYVLRAGRISRRQQYALDNYLDQYKLDLTHVPWDIPKNTIVEIGFGMGASLLSTALAQPDKNFIGIEVHLAGIGSLLAELHQHAVKNVHIAPYDAVTVLQTALPDASLAGVQIFFPDPWPKKRHHKRRLIQKEFISLLINKIQSGGFLHCATDWEDYAYQMLSVLTSQTLLKNQSIHSDFIERPATRPRTKFEQRGLLLGHKVWDLFFIRI